MKFLKAENSLLIQDARKPLTNQIPVRLSWNTALGWSQLSIPPLHELQQGQEVWVLTYIVPLPRKPKVRLGRALRPPKRGCFGTDTRHTVGAPELSCVHLEGGNTSSAHIQGSRVSGGFVCFRFQISSTSLLNSTRPAIHFSPASELIQVAAVHQGHSAVVWDIQLPSEQGSKFFFHPSCVKSSGHPTAVTVQTLKAHLPTPAEFPISTHFSRKKKKM